MMMISIYTLHLPPHPGCQSSPGRSTNSPPCFSKGFLLPLFQGWQLEGPLRWRVFCKRSYRVNFLWGCLSWKSWKQKWWIPPNLEIHFFEVTIFLPPKRGWSDTIGDLGWRGLSFHDFPRVGMIFPTLRKELEKAIDLLEQDTPYRFRVVTPPPGYGSLRFSRHKGSWWVREQNNRKGW